MGTQNFNFSGHLVLVAAERRNNNSHGRKPVDGNFNDFPAPLLEAALYRACASRGARARNANRNHGLTPVAKIVSPLRG